MQIQLKHLCSGLSPRRRKIVPTNVEQQREIASRSSVTTYLHICFGVVRLSRASIAARRMAVLTGRGNRFSAHYAASWPPIPPSRCSLHAANNIFSGRNYSAALIRGDSLAQRSRKGGEPARTNEGGRVQDTRMYNTSSSYLAWWRRKSERACLQGPCRTKEFDRLVAFFWAPSEGLMRGARHSSM